MKMTKEEEMTMKLIWEALFQCQDEDSIRLGGKYKDHFVVWRHGQPYKVTVEHAPMKRNRLESVLSGEAIKMFEEEE